MLIYKNYYKSLGARDMCHDVKISPKNDKTEFAIESIGKYLAESGIASEDTVLIPAPQHTGKAEYTLAISNIVAGMTGAQVCNVLECTPHLPFYDMKYLNTFPEIIFWSDGRVPDDKALLFVDNVMGTGYTYNSCNKLFKGRLIPFVYAIDFTTFPIDTIVKDYEGYSIRYYHEKGLVLERSWMDRTLEAEI